MKKILVANRGEIALRIMRTARKMGMAVVAVYSEADRQAPHVRFADEAVCLGPAPSAQSYLRSERILQAALDTGADAIHPGYGFLSENAAFAALCEQKGIVFIGPSPYSIDLMGSKLAAKDAVKSYGIPMVPGGDHAVSDLEEAVQIASSTGFPILIKASAGGGGKGMRLVYTAEDLQEQMERAISEAKAAFGDGAVFIEKYIDEPRHIEIQILADQYGNTVHLFERECSIQRRHQKVVEEAPSSLLNPATREAMGAAAVRVAQAARYVGAGTVEFLVDAHQQFYFLEMNTRLQVEHPVTELITGLDLVEQQIRIARGEPLSFRQSDLQIQGHAFELRVYAEDPQQNFLPSIGKLEKYQPPVGANIRVDDGYEEGMEVPIFYDPMLSKLCVFGSNRMAAAARMLEALEAYQIQGIASTLPFGKFVFQHPAFLSGKFDTHFVQKFFHPELPNAAQERESKVAAQLAGALYEQWTKRLPDPIQGSPTWSARRR